MNHTPDGIRRRAAVPRWMLAALPLSVLVGGLVGVYAPSVPRLLTPPAGPPDTLRTLGVPLPSATPVVRAPYLRRAVASPSPREAAILGFVTRYNVTQPLARMIYDTAVEEGIDPELAFRLVRVESVFDADAVGRGAVGLMQLMPGTARDIDPEVDTRRELLDPRTNLRLGLTNLRNMIELFDGDVRLGVIAYNRGEIAVQRALKRGRDPENGYGARVLGPRAHGGKSYQGKGLLEGEAGGGRGRAGGAPAGGRGPAPKEERRASAWPRGSPPASRPSAQTSSSCRAGCASSWTAWSPSRGTPPRSAGAPWGRRAS
jgi:hypothetical protein